MKTHSKGQSQRQLRVGEMLRKALSACFIEGSFHQSKLSNVPVTVTEVRVSPDLKNATVYALPLGNTMEISVFLEELGFLAPQLRTLVAKKVQLKHVPTLLFKEDTSFEEALKIETLLQKESQE